MKIVVIGYPGDFFNWGVICLRSSFSDSVKITHSHIDLNDFEKILPDTDGVHIISTNFPNPLLAEYCIANNVPVVGMFDNPINSILDDDDELKGDLVGEMRAVSASIALCCEFSEMSNMTSVSRGTQEKHSEIYSKLRAFVADVAREKAVSKAHRMLAPDFRSIDAQFLRENLELKQLSQAIGNAGYGTSDCCYVWHNRLFMVGETEEPVLDEWMDLVGPARTLYYGPYIHLPRGRYDFEIVMQFSIDTVGLPISIEIVNGQIIGWGKISAHQAGKFLTRLSANVAFPDEPIEVRIKSDEGAIFGEFGLLQVTARMSVD